MHRECDHAFKMPHKYMNATSDIYICTRAHQNQKNAPTHTHTPASPHTCCSSCKTSISFLMCLNIAAMVCASFKLVKRQLTPLDEPSTTNPLDNEKKTNPFSPNT